MNCECSMNEMYKKNEEILASPEGSQNVRVHLADCAGVQVSP